MSIDREKIRRQKAEVLDAFKTIYKGKPIEKVALAQELEDMDEFERRAIILYLCDDGYLMYDMDWNIVPGDLMGGKKRTFVW